MIKNFAKYNESLKDKMVGKTTDEIIKDIDNKINSEEKLDTDSIDVHALFELLALTHGAEQDSDVVKILLDNKYLTPSDIVTSEIDYLQRNMEEYGDKDAKYLLQKLVNLIKIGDNR